MQTGLKPHNLDSSVKTAPHGFRTTTELTVMEPIMPTETKNYDGINDSTITTEPTKSSLHLCENDLESDNEDEADQQSDAEEDKMTTEQLLDRATQRTPSDNEYYNCWLMEPTIPKISLWLTAKMSMVGFITEDASTYPITKRCNSAYVGHTTIVP